MLHLIRGGGLAIGSLNDFHLSRGGEGIFLVVLRQSSFFLNIYNQLPSYLPSHVGPTYIFPFQ